MKTSVHAVIVATSLFAGSMAWAQGAPADKQPTSGGAAAPAADKAAKPAAMPMPTKPAELQAYKGMIGNWKCEGKGTMGDQTMAWKGTWKASWDLDGYFVVARSEGKSPGMQGSFKGMDVYGYDAATKMYTVSGVDNMGGSMTATSKGWEGDKEEWTGKGSMMGKTMDAKMTITKKSDKEVTMAGSAGTDTWEQTCKK